MVRATRSFLCQRTGASRGLLDVFKFKKSFYLFLLAAYDAKLMSPAVRHEYLTRLLLQDSPQPFALEALAVQEGRHT